MKSKSPSDSTRSLRRRIQKARVRCDRSQRWLQTSEKLFEISKSLQHGDEKGIIKAINKLAMQIRMEAAKSPIQITLKAIHVHGCSNVQEISEQTLLPVETVKIVIEELRHQDIVSLELIEKPGPKTFQIVLKKIPFDLCDGKSEREERRMPFADTSERVQHLPYRS